MPHGIEYALQQALFPPFEGHSLTVDEFRAGYCGEDEAELELKIDYDLGTVHLN